MSTDKDSTLKNITILLIEMTLGDGVCTHTD